MAYLATHPEIEHVKVRVAFGPDEEIGRRPAALTWLAVFAYTMDGGPVSGSNMRFQCGGLVCIPW